jgi:hypothetical protein
MTSAIAALTTTLIVDDQLQNRKLRETLLRREGYRFRRARFPAVGRNTLPHWRLPAWRAPVRRRIDFCSFAY